MAAALAEEFENIENLDGGGVYIEAPFDDDEPY